MVKKTEVPAVQGNASIIRTAVTLYGKQEKTLFAAWAAFFGNMDAVAAAVAYKVVLEAVRTKDGLVLPKAECSKAQLLEYHAVATSKSRYAASLKPKASGGEKGTWHGIMHELATKKVKFLQAMKPEKTAGRSVDRLVVAWQVVAELTK